MACSSFVGQGVRLGADTGGVYVWYQELGEPRTMPWIDWWFNMAVIVTIGLVYYYAYLRSDLGCGLGILPID